MASGKLENALSIHADEAFEQMNAEDQKHTKLIFQALTKTDIGGRKIRRPAHLSELHAITGLANEKLLKLIHCFIQDKRSFIVINPIKRSDDLLIDISHESLIRRWKTLSEWVDEENEAAKRYLRLSEDSAAFLQHKKDLLSGTELAITKEWRNQLKPTAIWAARYNDQFESTMDYINKSIDFENNQKLEQIRLLKKRKFKTRIFEVSISILALVSIIAFIIAYSFYKTASNNAAAAETAKFEATRSLNKFQEAQSHYFMSNAFSVAAKADSLIIKYPLVYFDILDSVFNVKDVNLMENKLLVAESKSKKDSLIRRAQERLKKNKITIAQ